MCEDYEYGCTCHECVKVGKLHDSICEESEDRLTEEGQRKYKARKRVKEVSGQPPDGDIKRFRQLRLSAGPISSPKEACHHVLEDLQLLQDNGRILHHNNIGRKAASLLAFYRSIFERALWLEEFRGHYGTEYLEEE